jgi:oligoribonuclease NrnB/cAMP/cGMP phosphodiesterase (DHH superfamily)
MNPLCIYHSPCVDGFGAAWVVRDFYGAGNVDFHPGVYSQPPPDVTGRDVLIVDFSYKRPVLDQMAQSASSILILDHHKTAAEDLAPFRIEECGAGRFTYADTASMWRDFEELGRPMIAALFDMDRSGAGLTWDYFRPSVGRPLLIEHIEDRDLWKFNLPGTREIQAALFSFPYDFEVWDNLFAADVSLMAKEGEAIERKHFKDVEELIKGTRRRMIIGGHDVPVANLPYTMSSDAGHIMAKGEPFAACYLDTPEGRTFSLRSSNDGTDVSEIAKKYGGGGHRNAAGFKMPIGWEGDVL